MQLTKPDTISLRPARPADLNALAAIEQESFPDPSWKAPDFLLYDCTVAEVGSQVAGFLVSHQTDAGTPGTPPEREILNIAVAIGFRRLGVAARLLESEIQRHTTLFLEVRETNAAALHLYHNAGFKRVAIRRDYYDSPAESAIVMCLKW
jgi:ribosomal-protein-alanine N-acetyltransferase